MHDVSTPVSARDRSRAASLPGMVLFVGLFGTYLMFLHADLSWGDGPELTTAAVILGIPHPPGYPLYTLLGKLASLVPLGSIPWRLNLLSALSMAAASTLVALAIQKTLRTELHVTETERRVAACGATAIVFLAPIVWYQAVQTEVYALLVLLYAGMLVLLTAHVDQRAPTRRRVAAVAFTAGLCVVHHYLAAPVLLLALYTIVREALPDRRRPGNSPLSLTGLLLGFVPVIVLAVLPLRGMKDPAINWYSPHTSEGFAQLLLGGDFAGNLARGLGAWLAFPLGVQLRDLAFSWLAWGAADAPGGRIDIVGGIPWLLPWAIAIGGLRWMWAKMRPVLGAWGFLVLLHQVFYTFYLVGDRSTFAVPLVLLWSLPLAAGFLSLLTWSRRLDLPVAVKAVPILAILLPLLAFRINGPSVDIRALVPPRQYAEAVTRVLPEDGLLITGTWEDTADNELHPLLYMKCVERACDGRDIVGAGFVGLPWYRRQLRDRGIVPQLSEAPPDYRREAYRLRRSTRIAAPLQLFARRAWLEDVYENTVQAELGRRPVLITVPAQLHFQPPERLGLVPVPAWSGVRAVTGAMRWKMPLDEEVLASLPSDVLEYLRHVPGTADWTGGVIPLEEKAP